MLRDKKCTSFLSGGGLLKKLLKDPSKKTFLEPPGLPEEQAALVKL